MRYLLIVAPLLYLGYLASTLIPVVLAHVNALP